MWGGVETESNSAASSTPWGGSTGVGDASSDWNHTSWGGNTGAMSTTKSAWDSQQQQSNLTSPTNATGGVANVNGWTPTTSAGQAGWPAGSGQQQQQQWPGTSPGGSTWAGIVRHQSSSSASIPQTPVQPGPTPNGIPAGTTAPAASVRPKMAGSGFGGESGGASGAGTPGWGKPVDQGTPWGMQQQMPEANKNGAAAYGGPAGWTGGGGGAPPQRTPTETVQEYSGYQGRKVVRPMGNAGAAEKHQWGGGGGGSGWESNPAPRGGGGGGGGGMWNQGGGVDPPQREPPANVWVGPPAPSDGAESNMMWVNPYPKKTAQPDNGTSAWGQPTTYNEIKRWKTNTDGDMLPVVQGQLVQAGTGSTTTPQSPKQGTADDWNEQKTQSTWPDTRENEQMGNANGKTSAAIDRDAWGAPGSKQTDMTRNSIESDGGNKNDDVFLSNPTSPMTGAPGQPGSMMILNKQRQLPNGLGPMMGQGNNSSLNQLVNQMASVKLATPNSQIQNMSPSDNSTSSGQISQQQLQTQQISEQLQAAVRAGLIDQNILQQPNMPMVTMHRLNQLIQCVTKLEQAQKEMLQLQTQAANQPQSMNVTQQQELQRLSNDMNQLRQTIVTLKQAISGQQMRNGPGGDGGHSKLEEWRKSTSGTMNGTDMIGDGNTNTTGGKIFSVALTPSDNDPWSDTPAKRNSGVDWPQATVQNESKKEMDGQQQQINIDLNKASTPIKDGVPGGDVLLDDVPEFKPGQPWNWRDPKELAEDPDATPGSMKRPTLLGSVSSMVNSADLFGSAGNRGYGADFMGGKSGYMGGAGGQFYGRGQQSGGYGDSWSQMGGGLPRANRPPSQMGQPMAGRVPYKHSMSIPTPNANTGYMPPYNMPNASTSVHWVVLMNLNNMDEQNLRIFVSRMAPVSSCIYPPGAGFAVVKFKDVLLDKILPRLQQECTAIGLILKVAKDDEVSRLLQAVAGPRGAGPGALFGAPPPPPHHPGAMGPSVWDTQPSHSPSPWGPPPPPMHHHTAPGGQYPPHPVLPDPSMAMSMGLPPAMHDGLFSHDRHAPF